MYFQSMSEIRTPPSLKWLINRRARLAGEIKKLEKSQPEIFAEAIEADKVFEEAVANLERARKRKELRKLRCEMQLKALRADLQAVENTLRQHEIQIPLELISPIRTHDGCRFLPHGKLTSAIYDCLKRSGEDELSTTDITIFITDLIAWELSDKEFMELRDTVRYRLKDLCYKHRKIVSTKPSIGRVEGRWRLPDDGTRPEPKWKQKRHRND